jgi:hypothetical protein
VKESSIRIHTLRDKVRNRTYPVGSRRLLLCSLLEDRGFQLDPQDFLFNDANQAFGREGACWTCRAIDPDGEEVMLCGHFNLTLVPRRHILVFKTGRWEYEVLLGATDTDEL